MDPVPSFLAHKRLFYSQLRACTLLAEALLDTGWSDALSGDRASPLLFVRKLLALFHKH